MPDTTRDQGRVRVTMAERRQVDLQRVMTRISILVARNCFAPISEMWREAPRLWPSEAGVNLDRIKSA